MYITLFDALTYAVAYIKELCAFYNSDRFEVIITKAHYKSLQAHYVTHVQFLLLNMMLCVYMIRNFMCSAHKTHFKKILSAQLG